jgi:YjbE family integral membrane protein
MEWFHIDWVALAQVLMIDIILSGDNAIVIGMAVAGLPPDLRRRAIIGGVIAATVLRIVFSLTAVQLMQIIGLTLAGGILLLWVAYKMYRELRHTQMSAAEEKQAIRKEAPKSFWKAVTLIVVADVSMSLDNALAVAGAARHDTTVLYIGLAMSVVLMAVASNAIARLLEKHHWIAWVGLLIVTFVAGKMVYEGAVEVEHHVAPMMSELMTNPGL